MYHQARIEAAAAPVVDAQTDPVLDEPDIIEERTDTEPENETVHHREFERCLAGSHAPHLDHLLQTIEKEGLLCHAEVDSLHF